MHANKLTDKNGRRAGVSAYFIDVFANIKCHDVIPHRVHAMYVSANIKQYQTVWRLISVKKATHKCNYIYFDTSKPLEAARKEHNYNYVHITTSYLNIVTNYLNIITIMRI